MQTVSHHPLYQTISRSLDAFLVTDDGKLAGDAKLIGKQLAAYLGQIIKKDGHLRIDDKSGNPLVFSAIEVINLAQFKVSDVLSKAGSEAAVINAEIDNLKKAHVEFAESRLITKLTKDRELLVKVNDSLMKASSKLPLGSDQINATEQRQIFNALFEEVVAALEKNNPNYKTDDLVNALEFKIKTQGSNRGLTQNGLKNISSEIQNAQIFLMGKTAVQARLNSSNLIISYNGEFDEQEFLKGLSEGKNKLNDVELKAISVVLSKFIENPDKVKAKAHLERDLARLSNSEKAFTKYVLNMGEKLNSGIDLEEVFSQISNFVPGLLGSGLIGLLVSSLFGVSGIWGIVGSIAMTALAATDDQKQKPPVPLTAQSKA